MPDSDFQPIRPMRWRRLLWVMGLALGVIAGAAVAFGLSGVARTTTAAADAISSPMPPQ
jgi:hypothetical protein